MFGYSHCRYCLQEESTHFDIRVLTILVWRYRILLGLKKLYNKKSAKLIKISKLYQAFILHFLFQMFQCFQIIYCRRVLNVFLPFPTRLNYLSILSTKIGSIPFFLISWHTPIPPFCWIPCCWY